MRFYLIILSLFMSATVIAQPFLQTPVEGTAGNEYIIVNYVDWKIDGISDPFCGTKTYEGHEGTDYAIRSFRHMDSGVKVLAAADGKVIYVKDGEYDRETVSDTAKRLGNYIGIKHKNGYFTYYGHLKKGSLMVKNGDTVYAGQPIALVGSSGNSTDPHLHFEVYYDSSTLVDPFQGVCGNQNSLWLKQEPYDTSFNVWDYGMHNKNIDLDDLRERIITLANNPYTFVSNSDDSVVIWAHLYGLKKGDVINATWYSPSGQVWFTYDFTMEKDWWYYYFYTSIDNKDLPVGNWWLELSYLGKKVLTQPFVVIKNSGIETLESGILCDPNDYSNKDLEQMIQRKQAEIYDSKGLQLHLIPSALNNFTLNSLSSGLYYIQFYTREGTICYTKRFID